MKNASKLFRRHKILKRLFAAIAVFTSATSIGWLQNVEGRLNTAVLANLVNLQAEVNQLMVAPPTDFVLPPQNSPALVQSNVELANLLAQATTAPLAQLANVPGGRIAMDAYVTGPGAFVPALGRIINGVPLVGHENEFIACATLIMAAARAVQSAGGLGAPGLTLKARHAAAAACVIGAGGRTLGEIFLGSGTDADARALVLSYVGANGGAPALHGAGTLAGVFGGLPVDEAWALLNHITERGHFWQIPAGIPMVLGVDRHFLAWARAARVGTNGGIPPVHSAFIVPPADGHVNAAGTGGMVAGAGQDAVTYLHLLLSSANAAFVGQETGVSWGGNLHALTTLAPAGFVPGPAGGVTSMPGAGNTVGIHVSLRGMPGLGGIIKCNPQGGLAIGMVRSNNALTLREGGAVLGEAAWTSAALGPGGAIVFLRPLGSGAGANPASAGAPGVLNRVTIWIDRFGRGTMFAE